MHEKAYVCEGVIPNASVNASLSTHTEKAWHPDCDKTNLISNSNSQHSAVDTADPAVYAQSSSRIVYDNSGRKRYNYCWHVRRYLSTYESGGVLFTSHSSDIIEQDYEGRCGHADWVWAHTVLDTEVRMAMDKYILTRGPLVASTVSVDPYLGSELSDLFKAKALQLDQMAVNAMVPKLDNGFSMPRFLIELIELKFLWSNVLGMVNILRNGDWTQILGVTDPRALTMVSEVLSRPLRQASQNFLSVIFGWLPFLRDCVTIFEKFMNVQDDVFTFLNESGKRRTLHYQKALHPHTYRDPDWFSTSAGVGLWAEDPHDDCYWARDFFTHVNLTYVLNRRVSDIKYHATMDFEYRVHPEVPAALAQVYAELDYWGINLSISDVWEVIPFSFVVDWVFNVGSVLARYDKTNLPVDIVIYDYCRSWKYQLTETMHLSAADFASDSVYMPASATVTPSNEGAVQLTTHSYLRVPGIPQPSTDNLPGLKTPQGLHWVIASALAIARR